MARGGFSSVYEARHRIDQQVYAIKKIVLRVTSTNYANIQNELQKMLKEVRLFAAIKSPHVISYMHSWIEVSYSRPEPVSPCKSLLVDNYDPDVKLLSPDIEFESGPSYSGSGSCSKDDSEVLPPAPGKPEAPTRIEKLILYIQMELCKYTLDDLLCSGSNDLDLGERLNIAYQIARGLNVVHQEYGIIHRDVTPRNIFFARDGSVKLGDFGLATKCQHLVRDLASPFISSDPGGDGGIKELSIGDPQMELPEEKGGESRGQKILGVLRKGQGKKELTNGIGTKAYVSPEQMSQSHYGQSTDIYSVGLIYLLLFWPMRTQSERYEQLAKCRTGALPAGFAERHPELACLISQMTASDPSKRPTTLSILRHPLFARFRCDCDTPRSPTDPMADLRQKKLQPEADSPAFPAMVRIGNKSKCKRMYLKLVKGKLFGYKRQDKKKARFCYPLKECKAEAKYVEPVNPETVEEQPETDQGQRITLEEDFTHATGVGISESQELLIESMDTLSQEEDFPDIELDPVSEAVFANAMVIIITHPELETLYLMVNQDEAAVNDILNQ